MSLSETDIKNRMNKYGTIYFPEDIREDVDDILGNADKKERLEDFFKSLKVYGEVVDKLRNAKITPSLTMLLYGPPGTGKTSLTRAMTKKFDIPICVVEADRLVSPLLGDTVKNLRNVVEEASEVSRENGAFVLFFDEIDAVASERSNIHEVGEIKRAVISFLQIIDKVTYEGLPLAIFGATNHQNQLDSAVWRRFTFHLEFEFPDFELRKQIIESFLHRIQSAMIGVDENLFTNLDAEYEKLQEIVKRLPPADQKNDQVIFNMLEAEGGEGILFLTQGYTGADIERASRVALFKSLQTDILTREDFERALQIVGGTQIHVRWQNVMSGQASTGISKGKSSTITDI
jgi:SpoVK/Ycf46/Vps4 family AAA+-type ATPase